LWRFVTASSVVLRATRAEALMIRSLVITSLALLAVSAHVHAGVGDKVDTKFRTAPVNALGITGFADLRGKPVLVDFWGTR